MGSCPPLAGTVMDTSPEIAQAILNFLVENDLSLMDVINALIICEKVSNLPPLVKATLMTMKSQYQQTLPIVASRSKDKKKVVPKKPVKKIPRK